MESTLLPLLIVMAAIFLTILPAMVARSKGRSFIAWFIFALFLWPIAMIASIVIGTDYVELERRKR